MGGIRGRILAAAVAVSLTTVAAQAGVCEAAERRFIMPVEGPIVSKFDPPLTPFGSGHRGVDISSPEGSPVVASADGVVQFAGPVADDGLFVTVRHDPALETTYSFLSSISVAIGQEVAQGDLLGASGAGHPEGGVPLLHFGARLGGHYIDPELLLLGRFEDVSDLIALGAVEEDGGEGDSFFSEPPSEVFASRQKDAVSEQGRSVTQTLGKWVSDVGRSIWDAPSRVVSRAASGAGRFFEKVGSSTRDVLGGVVKALSAAGARVTSGLTGAWAGAANWVADFLGGIGRGLRSIASIPAKVWGGMQRAFKANIFGALAIGAVKEAECRAAGGGSAPNIPTSKQLRAGAKPPPPPNENIVVAVAGIGSHTKGKNGSAIPGGSIYKLDFETLGYEEDRVFHFSYAGIEEGRRGPYSLHKPYEKKDTFKDIRDSAQVLKDLMLELKKRYPDKKVDLVAHSQGGLVSQYFIGAIYDPDNPRLPKIDQFITFSTPHHGADAAKLGRVLSDTPEGQLNLYSLNSLAALSGLPPATSVSAMQMAEGSNFLTNLNRDWNPRKVQTTTIASSMDYVVTPQHTRLSGARHHTLDLPNMPSAALSAHSYVATSSASKSLLYSLLAERPVKCTALRNVLADRVSGALLSFGQDVAIGAVNLLSELP